MEVPMIEAVQTVTIVGTLILTGILWEHIGDRVELHDMTQYEIDSYTAGFKDNEDAGFFKY